MYMDARDAYKEKVHWEVTSSRRPSYNRAVVVPELQLGYKPASWSWGGGGESGFLCYVVQGKDCGSGSRLLF